MKIISFNVSWCSQKKIDWLISHDDIDIFVVPECAKNIMLPNEFNFFWIGNDDKKGLGVLSRNRCEVELPIWYDKDFHYAIPMIVEEKYFLLAVWPTKLQPSDSYMEICFQILKYYENKISLFPTLIIGDFNIISYQKNAKLLFEWRHDHKLESIHHIFRNEKLGNESLPTYYHQYKENAEYFIDYAFSSFDVKDYKLFGWNETGRMSDHVPLEVEI